MPSPYPGGMVFCRIRLEAAKLYTIAASPAHGVVPLLRRSISLSGGLYFIPMARLDTEQSCRAGWIAARHQDLPAARAFL